MTLEQAKAKAILRKSDSGFYLDGLEFKGYIL
jgi:hypothetical protein